MTRAPRAVLLDLDGTLIDTYRLYVECYRRALEPHLGHPPTVQEIIAHRPVSERHFLVGWLGEAAAADGHSAFLRHYAELHGSLGEGLYPGVPEMLAALRSAGYPLGLVTGKSRGGWEVTRAAYDLGEFAVVITEDETAAPKPDPGGLLLAARVLQEAPDDVLYIGDGLGDLRAGRSAGMVTGAALWAKQAPGEAEAFLRAAADASPDFEFSHPADVTRALASWC